MKIIAVDPGLISGVSVYNTVSGAFETHEVSFWISAVDFVLKLYEKGDVVCLERFVINAATAKKTPELSALNANATIEWFLFQQDQAPVFELPVTAKKLISDDALRNVGWYRATKGGHSNDATRHLLVYMLKNKLIDPLTLRGKT